MTRKMAAVLVVSLFALGAASAQTATLYDNFNQRFLNQSLWWSVCAGFSVTENCATDIQEGHLHLSRALEGNTDSNSGTNGGTATAFFIGPYAINSITTDILVRDVSEVPCPTNTGFGGGAGFTARFFNAGSGTVEDDVGGILTIERVASDPKGQLTLLGGYFNNGDYSHWVWLGNVMMGTPVRVTLTWDQPNHRFLYSATNKVTSVTTSGTLVYPFSDSMPPVDGEKHLDVGVSPANCISNQTWVRADALFDNVYVGQ